MKSTGVVRRIDDLGRIVIPKEIRKNLRIREGDTLEIYIDGDKIVLKKFSFISDLISVANKLVSTASNLIRRKIIITNNEKIIACSKELENKYLDQGISSFILSKLQNRMEYFQNKVEDIQLVPNITDSYSYFMSPIIVDSDIIGMVIIFDSSEISESDCLVGKMLSSFLTKNVEE